MWEESHEGEARDEKDFDFEYFNFGIMQIETNLSACWQFWIGYGSRMDWREGGGWTLKESFMEGPPSGDWKLSPRASCPGSPCFLIENHILAKFQLCVLIAFQKTFLYFHLLKKVELERFIPSSDLLSKCPGLGHVETRSPELQPVFPGGWERPRHLSHHLLLLRCNRRVLDWKQNSWVLKQYSDMGYGCPEQQLNQLCHSAYCLVAFCWSIAISNLQLFDLMTI